MWQTPKQSPRASAKPVPSMQDQKLIGVLYGKQEPKSTPQAKHGAGHSKFKSGRQQLKANSTNRTSPSPEGGIGSTLTQKEKECLARSKIAQEEKRFTSYLKRHYSPNTHTQPAAAKGNGGQKTSRFDYLGQLQSVQH